LRRLLSAHEGVLETLYEARYNPPGLHLTLEGADIKLVRSWFYKVIRENKPTFDNITLVNLGGALCIVSKETDNA
jgi:hypothetical protein